MIFRRRFTEVVGRQLDVFAEDERDDLLAEVAEMKRRYDKADRDDAEEAFGDYMLVVEAAKEALEEMRDRFERTLDDEKAAMEYESTFDRAAKRRWPWLV